MKVQQKINEAKSDKQRQEKAKLPDTVKQTGELAQLAQLPGGPLASAGDGSAEDQSALLADRRFHTAQRQAMATQIGQVHGNQHLQRLVVKIVQREVGDVVPGIEPETEAGGRPETATGAAPGPASETGAGGGPGTATAAAPGPAPATETGGTPGTTTGAAPGPASEIGAGGGPGDATGAAPGPTSELSTGGGAGGATGAAPGPASETETGGAPETATGTAPGPTAETAAEPTPPASTAGGAGGERSVSEAIHTALSQYQEMPIDVPANDPNAGETSGGEMQRVNVRVPYFLNAGRRLEQATAARGRSAEVRSALRGIPIETQVGKGSPAAVRSFIQSQVNLGRIRQGRGGGWPPAADDIRSWMQTYGIGIDCSGFVYWALWQVQASRGGEAAAETWAAQFQSGGRTARGYGRLMLQGAQQIAAPPDLQPGDIAQWQTSGAIGHYRIVMDTREEGEYFHFTLAESAGTPEGTNVREFRARTDAANFDTIQEQNQGRWRNATSHNRQYLYWRRAETAPPATAAGEQTEAAPGAASGETPSPTTGETPGAPEAPALSAGSLPSPEAVYGAEGGAAAQPAGTTAAAGPATGAAPTTGAPTAGRGERGAGGAPPRAEATFVLASAVAQNNRWGARLGWNARVDEIVSYFQTQDLLPPLQTPNSEGFAAAVRDYQSQYPQLSQDGVIGPNTWRQLQVDMGGGAPRAPAGAAATAGPTPAAGPGPTAGQGGGAYEYALRVTGQFESGGNYGAIQLVDIGVISYGKYQNTLASGNLYRLLQDWIALGAGRTEAPNAFTTIQDRVSVDAGSFRRNTGLAHDQEFINALREAGRTASMRNAQDDYHRRVFFDPAARRAQAQGVQSPIGIAIFFDTLNQGGLDTCIRDMGGANAQEMGERAYLHEFLDVRGRYLLRVAASQRRRAAEARSAGNESQARRLETTAGMLERAPQRRLEPLHRRVDEDLQ